MRYSKEPPPRGSGKKRAKDSQLFAQAVEELSARYPEWGLVAESTSEGPRIVAALRRLGCEVTTRAIDTPAPTDGTNGPVVVDIWARISR